MSNYEQLKADLERIKQEAAQKQEEARRKARLRKEAEVSIEQNWNFVKEETLKIFREINREVLNSQGKIIGWKIEPFYDKFDYEWSAYENSPEWSQGGRVNHIYTGEVEFAELRLDPIGKVCVYRVLRGEKIHPAGEEKYFDWGSLSFKNKFPEKRIKQDISPAFYIDRFSDLDKDKIPYSFTSPNLSFFLWKEVNSFPKAIRETVSIKIKDLVKRTLNCLLKTNSQLS